MARKPLRLLVGVVLAVLPIGLTGGVAADPLPGASRCPIFPMDSHWNLPVDRLPVLSNSTAMVREIGAGRGLKADFGSGLYEGAPIGIPFHVVKRSQKRSRVSFEYRDESDRVGYPIPARPRIEGGPRSDGDRHILMVDADLCKLYELYAAYPPSGGRGWRAGSGAVWSLKSNKMRPAGWTSADAAGLPILPGLARFDEVEKGAIDHALRFTVPRSRRAFIYPARHFASSLTDRNLPAMGQRFRLKKRFSISRFPRQARVVLTGLKKYGMILADNGSPWFVSGSPSSGWDNDQLQMLGDVPGSAFEAVDTSRLPRPRH